jgi:methionyl-tRNA formyltransferase
MRLRIALLRGDDHHNLYLDRLLRERFDVVVTIVEPQAAQRRALRCNGKWRDAIAAEYHGMRRTALGLNRYRRKYFAAPPGGCPQQANPSIVTVASINDPKVPSSVAAAEPDISVITCTTILSHETITGIATDIINVHGGHLPHYRGCHCFFFALYDGRFDCIGSTIHFVDPGVDTGDIIAIVRPAIRHSDNAEKLYCRAERLAAHRIYELLARLEDGEPLPRTPQPFRGRLCLRRDRRPMHDLRFAWNRLRGHIRLPEVDQGERWKPDSRTRSRKRS